MLCCAVQLFTEFTAERKTSGVVDYSIISGQDVRDAVGLLVEKGEHWSSSGLVRVNNLSILSFYLSFLRRQYNKY